jgi:sulfate transport system permease protein
VAPTLIVARIEENKYAEATALALVLLTASFLLLGAINFWERWSRHE